SSMAFLALFTSSCVAFGLFNTASAFTNTFTSFYYILQYLLKQLYFELLNKCFYIILQRFTTLLPLFCPLFFLKNFIKTLDFLGIP
ncbi:hypothetical protein, partial [Streptococcus pseudopneumoniae]|uniref:hypothetical protein n=1 Tax=Streptococcus pseudopneumoniae TaxID=257758 RepID=UPI0019D67C54